jgi:hypothetical protein
MGRKRKVSEVREEDWQFEEDEQPGQEYENRTLVLRKEPLPRKASLMASGVKEIRCLCCIRIKPIEGAEELGEGWICNDCLPEASTKRRHAGCA